MPEFVYDRDLPYFELVVPTKDTVRYAQMIKHQIDVRYPIFITGCTGVGKSVVISDTLGKMKEESNTYPILLTFSARTSSIQAENSITSKLDNQRKDLLGAPGGRKTVIMIDDVNMPEVEIYGAMPPIELMR
jgi:dynein heavy chain